MLKERKERIQREKNEDGMENNTSKKSSFSKLFSVKIVLIRGKEGKGKGVEEGRGGRGGEEESLAKPWVPDKCFLVIP